MIPLPHTFTFFANVTTYLLMIETLMIIVEVVMLFIAFFSPGDQYEDSNQHMTPFSKNIFNIGYYSEWQNSAAKKWGQKPWD